MKPASLENGGHDILDTMSDKPPKARWTVTQICDETGMDETSAMSWLVALQRLELIQWNESPLARQGWSLTRLGARFCALLQR